MCPNCTSPVLTVTRAPFVSRTFPFRRKQLGRLGWSHCWPPTTPLMAPGHVVQRVRAYGIPAKKCTRLPLMESQRRPRSGQAARVISERGSCVVRLEDGHVALNPVGLRAPYKSVGRLTERRQFGSAVLLWTTVAFRGSVGTSFANEQKCTCR